MYLFKLKFKISFIEIILAFTLIYQVGIIIELIFSNFILTYSFSNGAPHSDLITYLGDNYTNTNSSANNDKIPRDKPNYSRLIRYLSSNIAALAAKRPKSRAIGLQIANAGYLIADV